MKQHLPLLWTGRISGLLITLFFLIFVIGGAWPEVQAGGAEDLLRFLPYTSVAFLGFLVAWFNPTRGGWLLVCGAIILFGYFVFQSSWAMAFVFGIPPLLVGFCFLAAANRRMI
jgi:hypothetical protein